MTPTPTSYTHTVVAVRLDGQYTVTLTRGEKQTRTVAETAARSNPTSTILVTRVERCVIAKTTLEWSTVVPTPQELPIETEQVP